MKGTTVTAQKFRKKPIVIDAMHYDGTPESATPIINWMARHDTAARWSEPYPAAENVIDGQGYPAFPGGITIQTLEGDMLASAGDWIIKGVAGEFYPCKPDIFQATYEPAESLV